MSKKILLLFCALATTGALAFAELTIRIGADVEGQYRSKLQSAAWPTDPDSYTDMRPGFTLGAEYLFPVAKFLKVGAGAEYQVGRPIQGSDVNSVYALPSFIPLYGVARMPLQVEGLKVIPTARVGYGFHLGNEVYKPSTVTLGGGLYWAAGLGFELTRNLFVEGVYGVNSGTRTTTAGPVSTTSDVKLSKIELSLGYKLDI
ncbi:MAG: outer membrane beta-barrel protein [Spirochaetaceae bacterium]|nr:outer membrane beta-barrel protein [Spirochaetaceae bacterium]